MSDILDLIQSRRTIQQFLPKFVSWEIISKMIDAARHAPSSGNVQNWKFVVVVAPELKQKLAEASYGQYEISVAGALIVVCGEPEKAERYYGLRGERLYTVQNCAAAIQNMLLEAHSLGVGTRWVGGFDEEEVKSALGIPEDVRPQAIIAVGYPKEIPQKPPKYPLETIVYFNRWRNKARDPAKYIIEIATILARKRQAVEEAVHKGTEFVVDKSREQLQKIAGKKESP